MVRTSTTQPICAATKSSMKSPSGRVEWPMVKNAYAIGATAAFHLALAADRQNPTAQIVSAMIPTTMTTRANGS
jgi:hypothetical protein